MKRLPPLNAVKAFEASARHRSFSLAARELGVTPGAVSQQVRILEEFLAKDLFARRSNQVRLTDAGLSLYADCADVMDRLSQMTQRMLEGGKRPRFVVSTLASVAVRWLNRRLGEFLANQPEVRCEVRVEDDPVDFSRHHIDLRISYGEHLYPEKASVPRVRDAVMPMCSPAYLARSGLKLGEPTTIEDGHLIHIDWGASFASYPTWAEWFHEVGLERRPQVELGHTTMRSSHAVDLAAAGCGLALGQKLLARDELASGALITPFSEALPLGSAYTAVHPQSRSEKQVVRQFIEWSRRHV